MRQIKFRGVGIDGETYYGDLFITTCEVGIHVLGDGTFEVEPSSIAQLVEVIDGVEVYEGDTIERGGKKFVATLEAAYHAAD